MKKLLQYLSLFKHIPKVIRYLWGEDRVYVICMLLEAVFIAISPFPGILLVKYTIDMMTEDIIFSEYACVVMVLLALVLICGILHYLFNSKISRVRIQRITNKIANKFYMKAADCRYECLTDSEFLDKKEIAGYFSGGGLSKLSWNIVYLISSAITLIGSLYLLASIDLLSIVIVLVAVIIESKLLLKKTEINRKNQNAMNVASRKYNYYLDSGCDNKIFKDIKVFGLNTLLESKAGEAFKDFFAKKSDNVKYNNKYALKYNVVEWIMMVLVYSMIAINILYFGKSIGYFAVALNVVNLLKETLMNTSTQFSGYYDNIMLMEAFNEYMNYETDSADQLMLPVETVLPIQTIEFKNVSFRYPGQSNYALKNVSVTINQNDSIALIGFNGAGKTTFLKLLLRLYDPTEGEILINGTDIRKINRKDYYTAMSVIFQDFCVFSFTIRENINTLVPKNDDSIPSLLQKADLDKKIERLPNGVDTYIQKRYDKDGIELSGGEQQKLMFARSIYKKAAGIIVFDEPTAALDPVAEYEMYKRYRETIGGSVSFFVSHRLSCVNICNKIMLFDNGTLSACGTHDELMNTHSGYKDMYTIQSESYA